MIIVVVTGGYPVDGDRWNDFDRALDVVIIRGSRPLEIRNPVLSRRADFLVIVRGLEHLLSLFL